MSCNLGTGSRWPEDSLPNMEKIRGSGLRVHVLAFGWSMSWCLTGLGSAIGADIGDQVAVIVEPKSTVLTPALTDENAVVAVTVRNGEPHTITLTIPPPACNCLVQTIEKPMLAPGESTIATAVYEFRGDTGTFQRDLHIDVAVQGANRIGSIAFQIQGRIPSAIRCSPRAIVWSDEDPRSSRTVEIRQRDEYAIEDLTIEQTKSDSAIALQTVPVVDSKGYDLIFTPPERTVLTEQPSGLQLHRSVTVSYRISGTAIRKYEYILAVVSPSATP
jgi:hypothetical protein